MSVRHTLLLAVVGIALAACAGGSTTPTPSTAADPSPTAGGEAQRIEVTLSDQMRIEPAVMTVRLGQPVTFVVTNSGVIDHEFYLGDEAAQAEHEDEMAAGAMAHGHPNAVSVAPGATEELTFTFSPGQWLAGCHLSGHYPSGMRATITFAD